MRSAAAAASPAMPQYGRTHGGPRTHRRARRIERRHQRGLARRVRRRHGGRFREAPQRQREVEVIDVVVVFVHLHTRLRDYIQPGNGHPANACRSPRIFDARSWRPRWSRDRTVPIAHPAATAASW